MEKNTSNNSYGYGKRPLWQWILLYVIIGGVIYALVYYFFFAKKGGYTYAPTTQYQTTTTVSPMASPMATPAMMEMSPVPNANGALIMTETSPTKGSYLVGSNGMTIYVFDKDTTGVSNCNGNCAAVWPPFMVASPAPAKLPANLATIKRADGTMQYAYKGRPLYYYAPDQKPGDVTGDGVGGTWHLVKP